MCGGSLDYAYRNLDNLAEEIGYRLSSNEIQFTDDVLSPEEKQIVLAEVNALIDDLKSVAKRAKNMEWWLSGDTGDREYLEDLK